MRAKLLQSCLTLWNPVGYSFPCSSVHGILQVRILGWVAMIPPGDLPNPGIKPVSLMSPALAGEFFTTSATWEAPLNTYSLNKYELLCECCVIRGAFAAIGSFYCLLPMIFDDSGRSLFSLIAHPLQSCGDETPKSLPFLGNNVPPWH